MTRRRSARRVRQRVTREREDEQPCRRRRDARGFAHRTAELLTRAREIPDAVRDDQIDRCIANGQAIHWRQRESYSSAGAAPDVEYAQSRPQAPCGVGEQCLVGRGLDEAGDRAGFAP